MENTAMRVQIRLKFKWWFKWLYLSLTRFGFWLGLPLNEAVICRDASRGVTVSFRVLPAPLPPPPSCSQGHQTSGHIGGREC